MPKSSQDLCWEGRLQSSAWLRLRRSVGASYPRATQPVSGHRQHNDAADDDFLNVVGPAHLLAAVSKKSHDKRTNHGAQDAAFAAHQAASADDHGSDDVEFHSHRHGGIALTQT